MYHFQRIGTSPLHLFWMEHKPKMGRTNDWAAHKTARMERYV